MLYLLKKLFTKSKTQIKESSLNQELVIVLSSLVYSDNINIIFNNPVNKIYILNTYTKNLNDLLDNIITSNLTRELLAVNINSYFRDISDLKYTLKRVLDIISSSKINSYIEHDLFEIVDAYEYLNSLGG